MKSKIVGNWKWQEIRKKYEIKNEVGNEKSRKSFFKSRKLKKEEIKKVGN